MRAKGGQAIAIFDPALVLHFCTSSSTRKSKGHDEGIPANNQDCNNRNKPMIGIQNVRWAFPVIRT